MAVVRGLHVVAHGREVEGPLVVLLHGSMDRGASMARVARHLDGHPVVRYDRRGYGRSRVEEPGADLDDHVEDLFAVVDAFADATGAVVLGHSYGGVVALTAASRRPDHIVGVVAFEAPLPWEPWWTEPGRADRARREARDPADVAEAFLRRMLGDDRWEALPERTRRERRAEGHALVAERRSLRSAAAPFEMRSLLIPVVAGRGTTSPARLMAAADALAAGAPDGELVVIEGASHGAHLTHPERLAGSVRQLLGAIAASSA